MISKTGQIFKNLYFPFEVFDYSIVSRVDYYPRDVTFSSTVIYWFPR